MFRWMNVKAFIIWEILYNRIYRIGVKNSGSFNTNDAAVYGSEESVQGLYIILQTWRFL